MLNTSIILATYCPDMTRYNLCEQSFSEIHNTGINRNEYELIVVNNGGIHQSLIEKLDADIVITNSRNIGQGAALNIGASIARGINIAFVDDDLSYKERWLWMGIKMVKLYPKYVTSLRNYGTKFATGKTAKGHVISRNTGGVWIMRLWLYQKIGRFGMTYYDFGGLWTRNLLRAGHRFVVCKDQYIFHLGKKSSIIGNRKGTIKEYRRKHDGQTKDRKV